MRLSSQMLVATASTSGPCAQPCSGAQQRGGRAAWSSARGPPAAQRSWRTRVTNEGREMRMKEVQEQLEDPDYIWVDPDNPIPHPELGPLERRVSLHYEEALFMDEVDPEAMQYWFTCPPDGWKTEKRRLRKAEAHPAEEMDSFAHPGPGRTPLTALREGQELVGTVTGHLLYHGMQIDLGAEFDGLLPLQEEHWEELAMEASIGLDQQIRVRVYRVRDAALFRFPIQLEAVDSWLAERIPPPGEHEAPMDLRVLPMSLEKVVEASGRNWKPEDVYVQTKGEVDARNGMVAEARPGVPPPSAEQLDYITRVCMDVAGL